jgi:hypothetical protein
MSSKSDSFENLWMRHIFLNEAIPGVGDATGLPPSATAGNLFLALHGTDPGESGTQTSSEVSYTGYARVAVPRTSAGWTVTGNTVRPAANVAFPACTGGSTTATHGSVGTASTGAGMILYRGPLATVINIINGVTPLITTDTVMSED